MESGKPYRIPHHTFSDVFLIDGIYPRVESWTLVSNAGHRGTCQQQAGVTSTFSSAEAERESGLNEVLLLKLPKLKIKIEPLAKFIHYRNLDQEVWLGRKGSEF